MNSYQEMFRSAVSNLMKRVQSNGANIGGEKTLNALKLTSISLTKLAGLTGSIASIVGAGDMGTDVAEQSNEVHRSVVQIIRQIPESITQTKLSANQAYTLYNNVFNANLSVTADGIINHDPIPAPAGYDAPFTPVYRAFLVDAKQQGAFTMADAQTFQGNKPTGAFVAFLLVILDEDYKRKINNFDDWLSVPVSVVLSTQTIINRDIAAIKNAIDQVIYTANLVNKLSNLLIRKKALNALISDDLINIASQAGLQANQGVSDALNVLGSL